MLFEILGTITKCQTRQVNWQELNRVQLPINIEKWTFFCCFEKWCFGKLEHAKTTDVKTPIVSVVNI